MNSVDNLDNLGILDVAFHDIAKSTDKAVRGALTAASGVAYDVVLGNYFGTGGQSSITGFIANQTYYVGERIFGINNIKDAYGSLKDPKIDDEGKKYDPSLVERGKDFIRNAAIAPVKWLGLTAIGHGLYSKGATALGYAQTGNLTYVTETAVDVCVTGAKLAVKAGIHATSALANAAIPVVKEIALTAVNNPTTSLVIVTIGNQLLGIKRDLKNIKDSDSASEKVVHAGKILGRIGLIGGITYGLMRSSESTVTPGSQPVSDGQSPAVYPAKAIGDGTVGL